MNRAQINRNNMFLRVSDTLTQNNSVWQLKPAFADAVAEFKLNIKAISKIDARLLADGTGVTKDKNMLKENLLNEAFRLGGNGLAFGYKTKNNTLIEKLTVKKTSAQSYSDIEAADYAKMVRNTLTGIIDNLDKYNIVQADLDNFDTQITNFESGISTKNTTKTDSSTDISDMADLFKVNSAIIKQHLVPMMREYKNSNKTFYKAFYISKKITDSGGSSSTPTPPNPAPGPVTPTA